MTEVMALPALPLALSWPVGVVRVIENVPVMSTSRSRFALRAPALAWTEIG